MEHSEKYLKKRKALLVLPLLALPFVTLAFWSLGGGKGVAQAQAQEKPGMNTTLPSAQLSGASLDKMSLYNKAALDSQALKDQLSRDPFAGDTLRGKADTNRLRGLLPGGSTRADANEAKVRNKLAQLEQTLNQPAPQTAPSSGLNPGTDAQLARLQQSMQQMGDNSQPDPQLQQMNAMLEKILDIQHPERTQQQLRQQSLKNTGRVYPVSGGAEPSRTVFSTTGFYGLDDNVVADSAALAAIPAVVQETQTITSGSTIKLRLTEDIMVNGTLIPKNNFIYGNCNVDGERLKISISGIRLNNSLFPVGLSVYDLDALEGIRVPGAIGRDASKEGADRGVQSMQLMSLDPSLGAQAASAGLEVVKGFASKKVKLVRVTVKAGYPVLLMDGKSKQESGN